MNEAKDLHDEAMEMLSATSRTFFIPITHLPPGLQEAVTSAYLCMRAIDEIEDHHLLPLEAKTDLLRSISWILQHPFREAEWTAVFRPYQSLLPEVTLRLVDWTKISPASVAPNIGKATATMAKGMADWVLKEWRMKSKEDLDQYTFRVAGSVGLLLSDLWGWYGSMETNRDLAVAFGRGLQAVNILRNRTEDLDRGVDFFPAGWELEDMFAYARTNLALADVYLEDIKPGPIHHFCKIPLVLAHGTLGALAAGKTKLSRSDVTALVRQAVGE